MTREEWKETTNKKPKRNIKNIFVYFASFTFDSQAKLVVVCIMAQQQQQQQQKTTVWASVKVLVYMRVNVFTCVWISSFGVVHITLSGIRIHSPHFTQIKLQMFNVNILYSIENINAHSYNCIRSDVRLLLYSFSSHSIGLLLLFVIFVIDFVFLLLLFFFSSCICISYDFMVIYLHAHVSLVSVS